MNTRLRARCCSTAPSMGNRQRRFRVRESAVVVALASLVFVSECDANPYQTVKTFTVTSTGSSRMEAGTLNWAVFQGYLHRRGC